MGDYSAGFPGSNFQYGTNAREVALSKSTLSTYNTGFNSFIFSIFARNLIFSELVYVV